MRNILSNNFFHNQNIYPYQVVITGYDFETTLTQPVDEHSLEQTTAPRCVSDDCVKATKFAYAQRKVIYKLHTWVNMRTSMPEIMYAISITYMKWCV